MAPTARGAFSVRWESKACSSHQVWSQRQGGFQFGRWEQSVAGMKKDVCGSLGSGTPKSQNNKSFDRPAYVWAFPKLDDMQKSEERVIRLAF